MEKKANKKFIIAIAVMAMVVCLAVGGLVGVFAASQQAVTSSFDVQYRIGQNIAGEVSATYAVSKNGNSGNFVVGDTTATKITFDTTEGQHGEGSIAAYALNVNDASALALSPEHTSIEFTYTFVNTGATNFEVTLTDGADQKNVTVTYKLDGAVVTDLSFPVNAGASAIFTIVVEVTDANLSTANYTSTAGSALSWAIEYAA